MAVLDAGTVAFMLYGLVALLVLVAVVLFLAKVAIGGGILGVIALVLLVWVLMNARRPTA